MEAIANQFNQFLQTQLNEHQQAAVALRNGALLVIAGAGSGKTRVITSRVANLIINEQVPAHAIVALTFTNKAAGEMRERLVHFFQGSYQLPFVGTFHAYCLLLLRRYPNILPYPHFSIMDSDDQASIIKNLVKKYAVEKFVSPSQLVHMFSRYKNNVASGMEEQFEFPKHNQHIFKDLYHAYEEQKEQAHCLDFDDLLIRVLNAFEKNDEFKKLHQRQIRHVLIDEYQDTSGVQHKLLINMGLDNNGKQTIDSVCAVGDEDQAIYSWRGANAANVLKFEKDFFPVTKIKIEQNYRSVQPILEAANKVIQHNKLRNPKELWSTKKAHNRVLSILCNSGEEEAELIAALSKKISTQRKCSVAVLYRTHFQSRVLEEAFLKHALAYRIIGGIRFYDRKEIKDLLGYLRLFVNPFDRLSLFRVINTPSRGLGKKFEEELMQQCRQQPFADFMQIIQSMFDNEECDLTPTKRQALVRFLEVFKEIDLQAMPHVIFEALLKKIGYVQFLHETLEEKEASEKVENIKEFARAIYYFEEKVRKGDIEQAEGQSFLEIFLHEIMLLQEEMQDKSGEQQQVFLMTLHAAKGLEFDVVFIAGLEEGLLPSTKSLNGMEELEEERRLMYVGMTRAMDYLIVLSAQTRFAYGYVTDQTVSRFLKEIPKHLIQTLSLEHVTFAQARFMAEQWVSGLSDIVFTRPTKTSSTSPAQPQSGPGKTFNSSPKYTARPTSFSRLHVAKDAGGHASKNDMQGAVKIPSSLWKKNQSVRHSTFGTGIILDVEKATDHDFYLTVLFKSGKKKILSNFLQQV